MRPQRGIVGQRSLHAALAEIVDACYRPEQKVPGADPEVFLEGTSHQTVG